MQVTPLQIVLWSSAWAAVGWLAAHYLSIGRDSSSKRKRYRSFLELLRQKTDSIIASELFHHHPRTFAEFDKEALEVRPHIRQPDKFDAACKAYRSVEFRVLQDQMNADGKARVIAVIDELLRYAK